MAEKIIEKHTSSENNAATGAMMVILFICALFAIGFVAFQSGALEMPDSGPQKIEIQVPGTSGGGNS